MYVHVKAGNKHTLTCSYQSHFIGVGELEAKGKVVCYIYTYLEKIVRNRGNTISPFRPKRLKATGFGRTTAIKNRNRTLEEISSLPHTAVIHYKR